ncbi:hypothetical protein [Paracoccus pacificus]|uniref:LysE type translocator n=1 Tax=Paracoccus pacificus TaxID=1463598 RepID=A0ABW4R998_9RHOB
MIDALIPWLPGFAAAYAVQAVAVASPGPVIAAFVAGAFLLSLAGLAAYAVLLSATPFRLAYARARSGIEAFSGAFLTYVAFRLATDRG